MNTITQLLFALVLVGAAFWMFDNQNDQLVQARLDLDQVQYERDGLLEAARISGEYLATAAANDLKHTQELTHALDDIEQLRGNVDAGHEWLRVKATCSAPVPATAGAAGLADAGAAELAADARSDYFTLRKQLALSRRMILGLQDHLRSFCTTTPTPNGATK